MSTNSCDLSAQPFLHDVEDEEDEMESSFDTRAVKKHRRGWLLPLIAHCTIFTIYSVAFLVAASMMKGDQKPPALAYTPAHDVLRYEKVFYDGQLATINRFRGEPRPELDEAWHELLENYNIRISEAEFQKMNRTQVSDWTAIKLWDGSGYMGVTGKFLRQVIHSGYYPETEANDKDIHIDHCVDDIRQALMCHPDTDIVTFDWKPGHRIPWGRFATEHTCADWEALDTWAAERSFSAYDQKSLVHPELGLAFPLVNGKIEIMAHGPGMHIVWPEEISQSNTI